MLTSGLRTLKLDPRNLQPSFKNVVKGVIVSWANNERYDMADAVSWKGKKLNQRIKKMKLRIGNMNDAKIYVETTRRVAEVVNDWGPKLKQMRVSVDTITEALGLLEGKYGTLSKEDLL